MEIPRDPELASCLVLARQLHDTIAQRLTGLSFFLGDAGAPAPEGALEKCRDEIQSAIQELREALEMIGREPPAAWCSIDDEVEDLRSAVPDVDLDWRLPLHFSGCPTGLVDGFLIEAIRNVRKHSRPTRVVVAAEQRSGTTIVSVTNDGVVAQSGAGTRQGSRLLAIEATAHGAITESQAVRLGQWRQRLIMPSPQISLSA